MSRKRIYRCHARHKGHLANPFTGCYIKGIVIDMTFIPDTKEWLKELDVRMSELDAFNEEEDVD